MLKLCDIMASIKKMKKRSNDTHVEDKYKSRLSGNE